MGNKQKNGGKSTASSVSNLTKIIRLTSYIFTCVIFLISLSAALFSKIKVVLEVSSVCRIFAFSLAISLSTAIYGAKKLPFWLAHTISFFVLGALWYVFFKNPDVNPIVFICIYAAAFVLVSIPIILIRSKRKKKRIEGSDYESKF